MKHESPWRTVLTLDAQRRPTQGSEQALRDAVRGGADLRVFTEFWHDEHIDTKSKEHEKIQETMDFRVTYLLDDRWAAGILTLRQPIDLPNGFGPRPSMSFFLYNEDATQAVARPYLDGGPAHRNLGPSPVDDHRDMPKYHQLDSFDAGTNGPSQNFVYDFDVYKWRVREQWREVFSNDASGKVIGGSIDALAEAFAAGSEVKVAVRGLCADLAPAGTTPVDHEVFVLLGSCYYYTRRRLFMAAANPVVRVRPAIPLRYASGNWDFGWFFPRTDGHVATMWYDPYTLRPRRGETRCAMRWFVQ